MGLLLGKGHPVNRPAWPSPHHEGSALPVLINVGATVSRGSKAREHRRDPERRGWPWWKLKEGPEGRLQVGEEKEKIVIPDSSVLLTFRGLCLFSPSHFPAYDTIFWCQRRQCSQRMQSLSSFYSEQTFGSLVTIPATIQVLSMQQKNKGSIQFLVNLNPHFQKRRKDDA